MSVEDNNLRRFVPGKSIGFYDVRRLDRYAWHVNAEGHLYEYDEGAFWRTLAPRDRTERERIDDERSLPLGPWSHHAACDCEECVPDCGLTL